MDERYSDYKPVIVEDDNGFTYRRRIPFADRLRSDKPQVNAILFVLTILSTWFAGGLWYSVAIVSILLAHEMGHYLMCRRYGIRATLPFFIPFPLNPFGTLGAVIRMESRIPSRKALFDVGVAGPLAGLVLTIPAIVIGLQLSEIRPLTPDVVGFSLGESLLFSFVAKWIKGVPPAGQDIFLHPLAFAGWTGLFVTALNLLPIGQLDGGHIIYAILGRRSRFVFLAALVGFIAICIFIFWGWFLMVLLLIFFGYRHPPTMDETPLDGKRRALGIITFAIFLLSFTPKPFIF
jgi:membrane-associated protease RseP (regulator of RpoE activity)